MPTSEDEYLKMLRGLVQQLDKLVAEIEADQNHRRHTESTLCMIEESVGITVDLLFHIREEEAWREGRYQKLLSVLQVGRKGPNAYPIDPPAGLRKETK